MQCLEPVLEQMQSCEPSLKQAAIAGAWSMSTIIGAIFYADAIFGANFGAGVTFVIFGVTLKADAIL